MVVLYVVNGNERYHQPTARSPCCHSCPRPVALLLRLLAVEQTPWLDDKHVVFGEVIDGARTVKDIELLGSNSGKTSKAVRALALF